MLGTKGAQREVNSREKAAPTGMGFIALKIAQRTFRPLMQAMVGLPSERRLEPQ
jgi:hypothetical protein